jgi:TolB-like protein/class 3 adenylate cyclase/Flp pilus assembly protein TadD
MAPRTERKLAAILAADVVGYSRLVGNDEAGTIARLRALRKECIEPLVAEYHGRVVKLMGDGALVEFVSAVDAVECAVAIQKGVAEREAALPKDQRLVFRIGVNIGDILVEDGDILGDGVNVAARLEALAQPGGICVSRTVYDHVRNKVDLGFEPMGAHRVKNIPEPVTVYRVVTEPGPLAKMLSLQRAGTRRWHRGALAAAAVVLLVAAGSAGLWLHSEHGAPPALQQTTTSVTATEAPAVAAQAPLDRYRIAVLPFTNISADPEDEYFSDGMTEELISKLSRLHDLKVIARTSIMQYKETSKSVAEIGRELQVGTILEGSVRKAGDILRITAQLIDVASQAHLWSQDYDRTLDDVFAIQSAVAGSVANALEVTLGPAEKRQLEKQETQNLEAYQLYLHGLQLYNRYTEEGLKDSITYFDRALQHDPSFAQAYTGIAMAYLQLGFISLLDPKRAFENARSAAEKALALDDTIVDAQLAVAITVQILHYDHARARLAYERAVKMAPNSAGPLDWYGMMYFSPLGRGEEAIALLRRAVALDPVSVLYLTDLGWAYYMAHQYDAAIEILQRTLELEPDASDGYRGLGEVYVQKGMYDKAIANMQRYVELTEGRTDYALGYLGYAYGMAGQRDKALEMLAMLQDRAKRQHVVAYAFAPLYVGLGENDKAIDALWQDYEEDSTPFLLWLKVFPTFDPLHSDPRFIELLRRIGVEPE